MLIIYKEIKFTYGMFIKVVCFSLYPLLEFTLCILWKENKVCVPIYCLAEAEVEGARFMHRDSV